MIQNQTKCERINTNLDVDLMNESSSDNFNEALSQQQQQQQQQSYTEAKINPSEIEKLYLKIKEDWL